MDVTGTAGLLIGVVALAASFVIYRWQKQRKGLGCAVLTNRSLLAFDSPFNVRVHHAGNVVNQPRLVVLRMANSGNLPIEVADFERQITITFEHCKVLSAEVSGVRPTELKPALSVKEAAVTVEPCLLNPGDIIEIQLLLDGAKISPTIDCRIVGVQSVLTVKLPRDSWGKVWRVTAIEALVSTSAGILLLAIGVWLGIQSGGVIGIVVAGIFTALAGLWCWYSVSTYRRSRVMLALPPPKGH